MLARLPIPPPRPVIILVSLEVLFQPLTLNTSRFYGQIFCQCAVLYKATQKEDMVLWYVLYLNCVALLAYLYHELCPHKCSFDKNF